MNLLKNRLYKNYLKSRTIEIVFFMNFGLETDLKKLNEDNFIEPSNNTKKKDFSRFLNYLCLINIQ